MPTRAKSHTLRWSDLKFEKFDQEYCCVVTFHYLKGSNDPHDQRNEQGARRFFFAPKQERLHLDLSALLFAEAYTRGLFVDHLDVLLSKDSDRFPAIRLEVAKQAVLVAANTECELLVEQEMRARALNGKLQQFCLSIGILCYVSMYAFRRQAAQEAKSMHSTEEAIALLNHAPTNPTTMLNYDQHGRSLKEEIDARARQLVTSDPQYEKLEAELHNILEQTHETLQAHGHLPHDEPYQITAKNVVRYRALAESANQPDLVEIRKKLEEHLILREYERRGIT
ncbi:hypothetical protein J4E83_004565 [Alternaria metachromatica]|uniref:uncharacterized protein n=1 Tax=Alternaria metachromatica TaxID=283354 RepID=UPI0020C54912|nr:uncharacterized protein J4E83_004565 [Alternaria metachromatica]KAI4623174.1 hypothetical protein J4E83_004565 [Alternaria metachromatica]